MHRLCGGRAGLAIASTTWRALAEARGALGSYRWGGSGALGPAGPWALSLGGGPLVGPGGVYHSLPNLSSSLVSNNQTFTTFSDGCLGSNNDEGRSEMR